jgi:uncharacterized protein
MVALKTAKLVFEDPFALEWLDERYEYGEERFSILGVVSGRLLFVAYTLRDEVIRIISARLAEPGEKRRYYEENTR